MTQIPAVAELETALEIRLVRSDEQVGIGDDLMPLSRSARSLMPAGAGLLSDDF
jgi:hypothetical protein